MYETEIKEFEGFRLLATPMFARVVDTAIALMRAAAPKDEAAERHHCAGQSALACREALDSQEAVRDRFMRERAAVRAESAAEIERLRKSYDVQIDHMRRATAEITHLRAELAAVKAAAEPKDEAAEREHCASVADEIDNGPNVSAAHYIERERAAVRGPLMARIRKLEALDSTE